MISGSLDKVVMSLTLFPRWVAMSREICEGSCAL
jgi:hypothetical protein